MVDKRTRIASDARVHTMRVGTEAWHRAELLAVEMSKAATDILRHTGVVAPLPSTASVLRTAIHLGLDQLEREVASRAMDARRNS